MRRPLRCRRSDRVTPAMTSHFLDRVRKHEQDLQIQHQGKECQFCEIMARRQPAYIVAETNEYMAFLDTLPIRTGMSQKASYSGHTLVIPKIHVARLSDLSHVHGAALAKGITDVARAMEKGVFPSRYLRVAFHITGLQVASNQVYAQTVDHVCRSLLIPRFISTLSQLHLRIPSPLSCVNGRQHHN